MDAYRLLCTTPCSATLPAGRYRIGVASEPGSKPVPVDDPVNVGFSDNFRVDYTSYAWMRGLGVGLMVAASLAGLYIATKSTSNTVPGTSSGTAAGILLTAFGIGLGVGFVLKRDDATVESAGGRSAFRGPFEVRGASASSAGLHSPIIGLSAQF
jgi:hypothetical protein